MNETATVSAYPSIRQSLVIFAIVILMMFGYFPIVLFLPSFVGNETAFLVYYVAAFGSAFYIVHSMRRRRIGSSKYNFVIPSWRVAILLFVGTIALHFGVAAPLASLAPISDMMRDALNSFFAQTGVPIFIAMVIAAPVFEELIFRGIMLDGLLKRYKPVTAILVSSLLFGAVHLNAIQFILGTVLGCFFGWVYLRSRSVGACILLHMAVNVSGFVVRFFVDFEAPIDSQAGLLDMYGEGLNRFLIVHTTLVAIFVACVLVLRSEFNKTPNPPVSEVHT